MCHSHVPALYRAGVHPAASFPPVILPRHRSTVLHQPRSSRLSLAESLPCSSCASLLLRDLPPVEKPNTPRHTSSEMRRNRQARGPLQKKYAYFIYAIAFARAEIWRVRNSPLGRFGVVEREEGRKKPGRVERLSSTETPRTLQLRCPNEKFRRRIVNRCQIRFDAGSVRLHKNIIQGD